MFESVWVILLSVAFIIVILFNSVKDNALIAYCFIVLGGVLLEFGFKIPIIASIIANPILVVIGFITYIAIGILYAATFELPRYLYKNKDSIKQAHKNWVNTNKQQGIVSNQDEEFLNSYYNDFSISKNKDKILSWIILWPYKVLWDISHKPFIFLWNKIYTITYKTFSEITNKTIKNILK